jgi:hypothetical protein
VHYHQQISHIVLDEAHVALTQANFRNALLNIALLNKHPIPFIYLTATLPPSLVPHFKERLSTPAKIHIYRELTNHPEHRYIIRTVKISQWMRVVQSLINYATAHILSSTSKGIVFVDNIDLVKEWATEYPFYHAKLTAESQEEIISSWKAPGSQWIIATSALLHGINNRYVDCIIFVGRYWGMIDFVQGAGRAGRREQKSVIYLLHEGSHLPLGDLHDVKQVVTLQRMVTDQSCCHRNYISTCMDGKTVSCKDLDNAQPCGVCDPQHAHVTGLDQILTSSNLCTYPTPQTPSYSPPSLSTPLAIPSAGRLIPISVIGGATPAILKQSTMARAQENARIQSAKIVAEYLEILSGHCAICWMEGNPILQPVTHLEEMRNCTQAGTFQKTPPYNTGYFKWKLGWKFELSPAFDTFCAMPTDVVHAYGSHSGAPLRKRCPYANIQYSTAWVIFHRSDLFPRMAEALGYTGSGGTDASDEISRELYKQWLCQANQKKVSWNLMDVFFWGWNYRNGIENNTSL